MRHSRADASPRHRLPRPVRWLVRVISLALMVALVIVFLPRLTRLVGRLWPDPARTQRVSEILSHELTQTARLETLTVEDKGVLTSTVEAALLGEVQRVTIDYDYHASIGVDLKAVEVQAEGGVLTLNLPAFEILSDSITPTAIDRQDFWYPLTETRRLRLLAEEREKRAEAALAEANESEQVRKDTVDSLRQLVENWLGADSSYMTVEIHLDDQQPENAD